jgi:DivIVA domain-containing protein
VLDGERPQESNRDREPADAGRDASSSSEFGKLLSHVPPDLRDVSFATVVRGYDRREVDEYVKRVNTVIAELEISHSPQSAVKHALDRVGEQTTSVLQRAREAAEELTSTALAESEHATRRAKVEAEEMVAKAQAEADMLRVQAAQETEELVSGARSEAAARLRDADQQARSRVQQAQERLCGLEEEITAAVVSRRTVLEELRRTAAELDELASGAMRRLEAAPDAQETVEVGAIENAERDGAEPVADETRDDDQETRELPTAIRV